MNVLPQNFDLSSEQQNTTALIQRLLGKRIADRYVDFCRLAAGAVPLNVPSPMAAHALRELESIFRQTLEVPMEVAVTPSPEDLAKIATAKDQLRTLGYSGDALQRACDALRPRLSHKEQIEKIATRLGLASDGDLARAWKLIAPASGQAHGGRALHQSVAVDAAFRAEWQAPFETVIRGLMIALQGKYAAFMQRIDKLVAMPDRAAATTSFSKEIPGALPLLWHFFNRLETPDWLPHLAKRGLLAAPLAPIDEYTEDGSFLRQWPAGSYLLRMAKSADPTARARAIDVLRETAASTHADVQQLGMEILVALPPGEAACLVDVAEGWFIPGARCVMTREPHQLIKQLADGGEKEGALRLTRALFQVFSEDGKLATLFGHQMYEHHLPAAVESIAPVCNIETMDFLTGLLDQAVHINGQVKEDPPSDYSDFYFGEISDAGIKHDVVSALIGEIVHAFKLATDADPDCARYAVLCIRDHSPKIFSRILLYVLSLNPAATADIAEAYLTNYELLEDPHCRAEYGALARAWFPSLSRAAQCQILAHIDSVPDRDRLRFNRRFEEHEKKPPTTEDQKKYEQATLRNLVWYWREVLPADRKEMVEQLGDPNIELERLFGPQRVPAGAPDFSSGPVSEIIDYLRTWRPSANARTETTTVLAARLRDAAMGDALAYSSKAAQFGSLPSIYVRHLLGGLINAANNKHPLEWEGVLELVKSVVLPDHEPPPAALEGDDPSWAWTRRAAIDLLAAGLRRGAEGVPFAYADRIHELVLGLYHAAPRNPGSEGFQEKYDKFPYHGARSTSRGAAIELCILLIFWLTKDGDSEVGKSPRAALDKLPRIRELLDAELADYSAEGRIPRAILGRYVSWLEYFAEAWLDEHFPALFPDTSPALLDAAWLAHLCSDRGPSVRLAMRMSNCYKMEIARLKNANNLSPERTEVENRLADYLICLYIDTALDDSVFEQFWATAPARVRRRAMWFLGIQLELPPERLTDNLRARALSYWDRRLAAARTSGTPDDFRKELGAIGIFFWRKGIRGEWLMDQVLAMSAAGFAPGESHNIIDRLHELSAVFPDRAAEVLAALIRNQYFNCWVYMVKPGAIRAIFINGLTTGLPATASAVAEAINYLAAKGDTGCLDLLPVPVSNMG